MDVMRISSVSYKLNDLLFSNHRKFEIMKFVFVEINAIHVKFPLNLIDMKGRKAVPIHDTQIIFKIFSKIIPTTNKSSTHFIIVGSADESIEYKKTRREYEI